MTRTTWDRSWPAPAVIETARLTLEPLRVEHAEELAPLLDDERLHEFIGDHPAPLEELRERYRRQVRGHSADGTEGWFNWIARLRPTSGAAVGPAVGTVQATLYDVDGAAAAEVAWVIATPYQRHGHATEAAAGMVGWLREHGTQVVVAHVHPEHAASIGVARRLGLAATDVVVDGETRWIAHQPASPSRPNPR